MLTDDDKTKLRKNWRGRRLLACRLHDEMCALIDAMADDDLKDGAPRVRAPDWATRQAMKNMSTAWLHMVLTQNDGHVPREFKPF